MTINVPKIAHASVPAANQGYRFRYANTRQTVFIARKFTRSLRITRMAAPRCTDRRLARTDSWLRFARAERIASVPRRNSHRAAGRFYARRSSRGRTRETAKVDREHFLLAVSADKRFGGQHRRDGELFSRSGRDEEFFARSIAEADRDTGGSARKSFAEEFSYSKDNDRTAKVRVTRRKICFDHGHPNCMCRLIRPGKRSFNRFRVGSAASRFYSCLSASPTLLRRGFGGQAGRRLQFAAEDSGHYNC